MQISGDIVQGRGIASILSRSVFGVLREPKVSCSQGEWGVMRRERQKWAVGRVGHTKLAAGSHGGLQAGNIMMELLFPKISLDVNG